MSKSGKRAKHPAVNPVSPPAQPPADDATIPWWCWVLMLAPVLFNAIYLAPELSTGVPAKNDSSLHLLMIQAASDALRDGHNPFDFWIPQLEMGFPQFLYYQHLPHLAIVALNRLLFGTVSLERLFHVVQYLMLCCFPITVAWSMRRMGFSPVATAVGAAVSTLLAGGRMSFDYNSYLWRGPGLYTQLWGMHLSLLALASLSYTVNEGRGYVKTVVLLAALALSHLVYASMMGVTSLVVVAVGAEKRTLLARFARLAVVGVLAIVLASYMLWPFIESSRLYLSSSPGGGAEPTGNVGRAVRHMFNGRFLDGRERLPVLTLLAGIGMVVAALRRGRARVLALVGLVVWLFLFVGRDMLGPLASILPTRLSFVSYRFIGAVDIFAIFAIGVTGEALWSVIQRAPRLGVPWRPALFIGTLVLLFMPAILDRTTMYNGNRTLINETRGALAADHELTAVLDAVENRPGRVFAGLRRAWGGRMNVGRNLLVVDLLKARQLSIVGDPYQGLALNTGLTFNFLDARPGLFDAYDVRTVITKADVNVPPFLTPITRNNRYVAWNVGTTGIAGYVAVTERQTATTQREFYRGQRPWFTGDAPGNHRVTRWDYMVPAGTFTPVEGCADGGRTLAERVESQRVAVTVQCPNASALVLKMSYHPNWKVRIDGVETPTYIVSPSFIGMDMPLGKHEVVAEYVPTPSKTPLIVLALIVLVLATVFRERLDVPAQRLMRAQAA
jgi:hypothetical protein